MLTADTELKMDGSECWLLLIPAQRLPSKMTVSQTVSPCVWILSEGMYVLSIMFSSGRGGANENRM